MKTFLFPVLAFVLVSCASQGVVPLEVTVTSTPLPTETPLPTATATPVAVDGVADVDGTLYIFDETTQAWTELPALEAPYAKVIVDENNKVVAVDADGEEVYALDMATGEWVKKLSETAVAVELEGNPFSGQGIEVTTLNEITLSQDDLPMMADYLDALATVGLMPERDVTGQRGAMQLGPSSDGYPDLVMSLESGSIEGNNFNFLEKYGWQPMFKVDNDRNKGNDFATYRWRELNTRPVMVAFDYADGGVIFAVMMPDKNGDLRVTGWGRKSDKWVQHYGDSVIDAVLNYDSVPELSLKKVIPVAVDIADVNSCVEWSMDEGMRGFCEQVVAQRLDLRAAYEKMLKTGEIPSDLRNGDLITLLGFVPAHP